MLTRDQKMKEICIFYLKVADKWALELSELFSEIKIKDSRKYEKIN
jgi:hypothetical protein